MSKAYKSNSHHVIVLLYVGSVGVGGVLGNPAELAVEHTARPCYRLLIVVFRLVIMPVAARCIFNAQSLNINVYARLVHEFAHHRALSYDRRRTGVALTHTSNFVHALTNREPPNNQ